MAIISIKLQHERTVYMNINIDNKALDWFSSEMNVQPGDTIRFFARYGGDSSIHSGYSLGVTKENPIQIGASVLLNDATFYVNENDLWYFANHDLAVSVNQNGELQFDYNENR